jgi:hypothetical protein
MGNLKCYVTKRFTQDAYYYYSSGLELKWIAHVAVIWKKRHSFGETYKISGTPKVKMKMLR